MLRPLLVAGMILLATAPAFAQTTFVEAGDTENSAGVSGSSASTAGNGFAVAGGLTQNLVGETAQAGVQHVGVNTTTNTSVSTVSAGQDVVGAVSLGAGSKAGATTATQGVGQEIGVASFHFP